MAKFIEIPLDDVEEPQLVPEGRYDLRIIKTEDTVSKAGNEMTALIIKVEDERYPDAQVIRHWLTYPNHETPPDQRKMRMLDIKRFLKAFHVPYDGRGFDSDDLVGQTGNMLVYQEDGDDGNTYNRIQLPRLDKEERRRA